MPQHNQQAATVWWCQLLPCPYADAQKLTNNVLNNNQGVRCALLELLHPVPPLATHRVPRYPAPAKTAMPNSSAERPPLLPRCTNSQHRPWTVHRPHLWPASPGCSP